MIANTVPVYADTVNTVTIENTDDLTADTGTGSYNSGQKATVNGVMKSGLTFKGWYKKDGTKYTALQTGTSPAINFSFPVQGNTVLAANHDYNISYALSGGSNPSSNPKTFDLSNLATGTYTPTLTAPTRTGYQFGSWSGDTTITSTGNKTITASWTPNTYTIAFNKNGGSGSMSSMSMTYGTPKNLTARNWQNFYKKGYFFDGWAATANGAKKYNDGASVTNLTATNGGTATLYAHWNPCPILALGSPNNSNVDWDCTILDSSTRERYSGTHASDIYVYQDRVYTKNQLQPIYDNNHSSTQTFEQWISARTTPYNNAYYVCPGEIYLIDMTYTSSGSSKGGYFTIPQNADGLSYVSGIDRPSTTVVTLLGNSSGWANGLNGTTTAPTT